MKRVNYGHRIVYQMKVSQIYYDQEQKQANKVKTNFNVKRILNFKSTNLPFLILMFLLYNCKYLMNSLYFVCSVK